MNRGPLALVRRILSEKRMLAGLAAVGLLADAGLYGLAVYPWTLRVEGAGRRAEAAEANLEAARQRFEAARLAADGEHRTERALRAFHQQFLPRDLAGARSLTLARLAALADDHGLVMQRRSSASRREDGSLLARLQVSMLLSGAYRDIRRFVHAIETAPEFLVIDEIFLRQGGEADGGEVLGLELSTYYYQRSGDAEVDEPS